MLNGGARRHLVTELVPCVSPPSPRLCVASHWGGSKHSCLWLPHVGNLADQVLAPGLNPRDHAAEGSRHGRRTGHADQLGRRPSAQPSLTWGRGAGALLVYVCLHVCQGSEFMESAYCGSSPVGMWRWGYLDAESVVRGGAVLLLSRDQGENVALLQVSQQLQVPGFLWGQSQASGEGTEPPPLARPAAGTGHSHV